MKTINLEEILDVILNKSDFDLFGEEKNVIIDFGKESIRQVLELAAENAKITEIYTDDYYKSYYSGKEHYAIDTDGDGMPYALTEFVINKQSILNTINQVK